MPPASTSAVTTASSMSSSSDISLPPSPSPSPPHDPYAFASSDEISAAPPPAKKSKPKNRGGPQGKPRTWPPADELALLEAVAAHKAQHSRLPSGPEVAAAVAGTLPHVTAEQVSTRVGLLRQRYDASVRRLRRGTVPVTDDDVRAFRLSKRIWDGEPKRGWRRKAAPHHERRGFEELRGLYPCLASMVEAIDAGSGCPGTMRRAFGMMGDEQAAVLEAKVRKQTVAQMKAELRRDELRSKVFQAFIGAMEE